MSNELQATVVKRISWEEVIEAWEKSNSIGEVKDKLGISIKAIKAKVRKFEKETGIALKTMPVGGGSRLNKKEAFALLAKLRNVSVEDIEAEAAKLSA